MKRAGFPIAGLLIIALTSGCAPGRLVYTSGPYRGKVVDAETKKPLVGAVVLATWYREAALFGGHGPAVDYHDALEVLTDAQGEFEIPKTTKATLIGKIREPELVIYAPGYGFHPRYQVRPQGKEIATAYEQKIFHVELPRLKTREERLDKLPARPASVPLEKIPNFTRLINVERVKLGLTPLPLPNRD